jgi:hypothetical protein
VIQGSLLERTEGEVLVEAASVCNPFLEEHHYLGALPVARLWLAAFTAGELVQVQAWKSGCVLSAGAIRGCETGGRPALLASLGIDQRRRDVLRAMPGETGGPMSLRLELLDIMDTPHLNTSAKLDAMLDLLTERADEWIEAESRRPDRPGDWRRVWEDQVRGLLAVLRDPGEQ